jgi:hypothetical protein
MAVTIVTSHWKEDLNWLKCEFPIVLIDKEDADPTCFEPAYTIPNKGHEASAYLKFIIEFYDDLPDHVAFIHGHEKSHHQRHPLPILDLIRRANISKYDYINLNDWYNNFIFLNEPKYDTYVEDWWDIYMFPEFKKPPRGFPFNNMPMAAQFIVSKKVIRANPIQFYIKCYDLLLQLNVPKHAVFFEMVWHVIFGQDIWYTIPRDMFDIKN